jgi:phosphoglycerol transferase MdoB-like AlkP superfamily enzyme
MTGSRNILRAALFILFLGLIQRLFLGIICIRLFQSFSDILSAFISGFFFDLSFISIVFLGYFFLQKFVSQKILLYTFFMILSGWIILNALDVYSINYTGSRLSCFSFSLFTARDLSARFSFDGLFWLFILFNIFFLCILYFLRKKVVPEFNFKKISHQLILVLLLFVGTQLYLPYPLNYYSDQLPVSKESRQLAVNPFYSWVKSFLHSDDSFIMDKNIALSNFKKEMHLSVSKTDFLSREVNYPPSDYNSVILIIMESFGANRIGTLGGEKKLSPNFDSLCKMGTLYSKCFSCGPRTQYSISSILFGFPHILGYNLFRKNKLKLPFTGLPSMMKKNNYKVHFLHGGFAQYDDMDKLVNSSEPIIIKDASDIKKFKFKNKWGVDDESFFSYCSDYIGSNTGKNFYCILSMSNHEPFQVPEDFVQTTADISKAEKAFLYSDHALGKFIEKIKSSPEFAKTLIIITGDHGELYTEKDSETKLFHVPLLVIDHGQKNIIKSQICSHDDIAEFTLSRTGYHGESHLIGRGLTGETPGIAYYRNYNDEIYKVTDSVVFKYNLKDQVLNEITTVNLYPTKIQPVIKNSSKYKILSEDIKSFYTSCKLIFESGSYHSR